VPKSSISPAEVKDREKDVRFKLFPPRRSLTLPGGYSTLSAFSISTDPPGEERLKPPVGERIESSLRVLLPQQMGLFAVGLEGSDLDFFLDSRKP